MKQRAQRNVTMGGSVHLISKYLHKLIAVRDFVLLRFLQRRFMSSVDLKTVVNVS